MSVIESTTAVSQPAALPRGFDADRMRLDWTAERDASFEQSRHDVDEPSLALMGLTSQGVIVMDADGRVLSCNDRFTTMIGVPLFVLLDRTLDQYLSPRQALAFRALQIADDGGDRSAEFALRDVDNASVPVRISISSFVGYGRGRCVVAAVTDLRPERASQQEIAALTERLTYEIPRRRAAEERLDRALRASGMASWECELGSGRAVHAVGVSRVLSPTLPRPWTRQALIDAFVPSDREAMAAALAAAEVSGSIDLEARVAGPDATPRWIRLEGRVRADAGTLAGFLTDVTSVREGRVRLLHAADMEAVGQMAAGIAHDLNNFLHVVAGNLELLGRHAADDGHVARLSGKAHRALLRAARLSNQLLAFSRGQALQRERLVLSGFVTSVRDLLGHALPATVRLRIDVAADAGSCTTDLYQLESALLNIAINARDAMPDGGVLRIGVENRHVDASCASSLGITQGEYLMISVSDTGSGMPPDVVMHAFDPFFTTKAPGKGTGLGLSQVSAFARRSNGCVTLDSEVGQGSRVCLFLPRDE